MNDPELNEFVNDYARYASNLFREPFSDTTWKRQSLLILSSSITILISLAIISPKESELLGLKFEFLNSLSISLIGSLVTFYFIVIYLLSVQQDIAKEDVMTLPLQLGMSGMMRKLEEQLYAQHTVVKEGNQVFWDEIMPRRRKNILENQKIVDEINKGYFSQNRLLLDQRNELLDKFLADGTNKSIKVALEALDRKIESHRQEWKEKVSPYEKIIDDDIALTQTSDKKIAEKVTEASKEMEIIVNRMTLISKALQKNKRFQKARQMIEIAFPTLLGIIAICISLLQFFQQ